MQYKYQFYIIASYILHYPLVVDLEDYAVKIQKTHRELQFEIDNPFQEYGLIRLPKYFDQS